VSVSLGRFFATAIKQSAADGKALSESFVIRGSGDTPSTFSFVMLQQMMADLMHEHIEEHEVSEGVRGPGNDRLSRFADRLDPRPRSTDFLLLFR
jgi:hypothetical protein